MPESEKSIKVYVHPRKIDHNFERYIHSVVEKLVLGDYFKGYGFAIKVKKVIGIRGGKAELYSPEISFDVSAILEFIDPENGSVYDMVLGSLTSSGAFMEYGDLFRVFVSLSRMPQGSNIDLAKGELRLMRKIGDMNVYKKRDSIRVKIRNNKTMNNIQHYVGDFVML